MDSGATGIWWATVAGSSRPTSLQSGVNTQALAGILSAEVLVVVNCRKQVIPRHLVEVAATGQMVPLGRGATRLPPRFSTILVWAAQRGFTIEQHIVPEAEAEGADQAEDAIAVFPMNPPLTVAEERPKAHTNGDGMTVQKSPASISNPGDQVWP